MRPEELDRQPTPCRQLVASSLESVAITEDTVRRHLKGVNTTKALGPRTCVLLLWSINCLSIYLSPHLIRRCTDELSTSRLVQIFKQWLQKKVWPALWKEAIVTLVHKRKSNNYRPSSLLSVFGRKVREQLTAFVRENHLLSRSRSDFGEGALPPISSSSSSLMIALDIVEAFDRVASLVAGQAGTAVHHR